MQTIGSAVPMRFVGIGSGTGARNNPPFGAMRAQIWMVIEVATPVDVGVLGLLIRGEPVAAGRRECRRCCRIKPAVTSASRPSYFRVAIREGRSESGRVVTTRHSRVCWFRYSSRSSPQCGVTAKEPNHQTDRCTTPPPQSHVRPHTRDFYPQPTPVTPITFPSPTQHDNNAASACP